MEEIIQEDLIEIIEDLLEEEDLTFEEEQLLSCILFILENIELDEDIIHEIFIYIDKAFMDEDEEDEYPEEEEDEVFEESFNGLIVETFKAIRGGNLVTRKPGFKKMGGRWVKIKASTLRKQKQAGRKRRHKKIKASTKKKMLRSRRKVFRLKKSVLKRLRKQKK